MAVKKSKLYSALWESCNALRGTMDASQYKDYVLMILFVKYLSDKAHKGETDLTVPDDCYFEDFVALKQNPHIGEKINEKLEAIREANSVFIGSVKLPNFNDDDMLGKGSAKVDTLSKLIGEFERDELDFSLNRTADDDLLGDAYEYLMKNFAVESGKSKGQFYTPAEVSRVIAKILHMEDFTRAGDTIYDMTCGSGSLLLRALNETPNGLPTLYGQEKEAATASLAMMNMLLHGIVSAEIKIGDTLKDPQFKTNDMLDTFDVCVANPPFSDKKWFPTNGESDAYHRWNPNLLPPKKCGDYAFLLHLISSMKYNTGRGACILPHGVLFRGNSEYTIRKHIIEEHYLKGIIGLPSNLFFGTTIPACILVLDMKDRAYRDGIFFINAKDGFTKDGNMNRLRERDIKRIVDVWNAQEFIPYYSRYVQWDEIKRNDYNLNIPRYIQSRDTEIQQDIDAHLHGGLPKYDIDALSNYWEMCPTLKNALFREQTYSYRFDLVVGKDEIVHTISGNDSFKEQQSLFEQILEEWQSEVIPRMKNIGKSCHPKQLINEWSEMLLQKAKCNNSLVDAYALYDRMMNYWAETMQDDCYMVSNDGWVLPSDLRPIKKKCFYTDIMCDLLPVDIVLDEFFTNDIEGINQVQQEIGELEADMDEYVENYSDVFDEFDKVNESIIRRAVKEASKWGFDEDMVSVMNKYLDECKKKKEITKRLLDLKFELTEKVLEKYSELSENDICNLVVEKKWIAAIVASCREEMQNVTQQLSTKVKDLVARYENTLSVLDKNVRDYEESVNDYLKEMGFKL
ncbi:MAG: type I restriction-modification system subunit M [Prevotella sp.]|nr:type I restriction-modification system subunit M [Prevotella sp.]